MTEESTIREDDGIWFDRMVVVSVFAKVWTERLVDVTTKGVTNFVSLPFKTFLHIIWKFLGVEGKCWVNGLEGRNTFCLTLVPDSSKRKQVKVSERDISVGWVRPQVTVDEDSRGDFFVIVDEMLDSLGHLIGGQSGKTAVVLLEGKRSVLDHVDDGGDVSSGSGNGNEQSVDNDVANGKEELIVGAKAFGRVIVDEDVKHVVSLDFIAEGAIEQGTKLFVSGVFHEDEVNGVQRRTINRHDGECRLKWSQVLIV